MHVIPSQRLRRRRQTRRGVFLVGQVTTPTGIHECRVLDLSPNGAKLRLSTFVWINQPIRLTLDSLGVFFGVVVWRRNGCIGIAIREHLPAKQSAIATVPVRGPQAGLRGIRVGGPAWRLDEWRVDF
jgi:PilZ domain-containing protein